MNERPTDHAPEPIEAQLERLLAETESTAARLRQELEKVRGRRGSEISDAEQHAEIDRLQQHLSSAQVHWSEVRSFFEAALQEILSRHVERHDPETLADHHGEDR